MNENKPAKLICRTCLTNIVNKHYSINTYSKSSEKILIKYMIKKCIPEMDLENCDNPVICGFCYDLLKSAYIFKTICFRTEERTHLFMEENNLKLGDKICFENLANFCIRTEGTRSEQSNSINLVIKDDPESDTDVNVVDVLNEESNSESDLETAVVETSNDETDRCTKNQKTSGNIYLRREYTCHKCEYKGARKDLLKKHLRKCNSEVKLDRKYKCDECSYAATRKRHLTRHKMTHGGKRPYTCGICDKGFTEKHHLKDHMYKHSGELPFKCGEEDCNSAFTRKCDLNAHMIARHVKYRPFMCKLCKKGFLNQAQWSKHMKISHKIKTSDQD